MNSIIYDSYREDGIFGRFFVDGETDPFCVTLSHAYKKADGNWLPIVVPGEYTCVRGDHALSDGVIFQTFEITGINGHSGLLFHPGNYDRDSHGCTLLGERITTQADGTQMITNSRATFLKFMAHFDGVDSFQLKVS